MFTEVLKPIQLIVTKDNIYIIEKFKINIFNRETFKFKKSFGRKGEGPKEFPSPILVYFFNKKLVVCAFNKILWFSKEGNFIEEKKHPFSILIIPVSGGYLKDISNFHFKKNFVTREIGIFDEDMNIKKMLFKKVIKFGSNRSRKEIEVFSPRLVTITDKKI